MDASFNHEAVLANNLAIDTFFESPNVQSQIDEGLEFNSTERRVSLYLSKRASKASSFNVLFPVQLGT